MERFTQKWTLVSFLDPIAVGTQFFWKNWPLHVTLAGTFAVDWDVDNLLDRLTQSVAEQQSFQTTVTGQTEWGDTSVMLLDQNQPIMNLHRAVFNTLSTSGAVFNDPQYVGEGYTPHSTIQESVQLQVGDVVTIKNLAIVNMFPDGDGYQRQVWKILPLATVQV